MPSDVTITVEVAATDESRARGLMHRSRLGLKNGMIFFFDETGYHSFYMYNTLIPLSVIFLDESLRIVDIQEMSPCMERDPFACRVYRPAAACKYAIEVNPGLVEKYGIKKGSRVKMSK